MTWVAHFLLLLFVAVSSGAIGWVLGVDEAKRQAFLRGLRGEKEPCHHLGLKGRIYPPSGGGEVLVTCMDCGEWL